MQGREDVVRQDGNEQVAGPLEAAWETIRANLKRDCGARTFDGWLKPAELGDFDAEQGILDIVMPSQFMADWVRSHFGDRLQLAWTSALPIVSEVRVVADAAGGIVPQGQFDGGLSGPGGEGKAVGRPAFVFGQEAGGDVFLVVEQEGNVGEQFRVHEPSEKPRRSTYQNP